MEMSSIRELVVSPDGYPLKRRRMADGTWGMVRDNAPIRKWAWDHHILVSDFGQLPFDVVDKYLRAHAYQLETTRTVEVKIIEVFDE